MHPVMSVMTPCGTIFPVKVVVANRQGVATQDRFGMSEHPPGISVCENTPCSLV